ncbi:transferase [Pygmaiobacter massiliensis]|uniref:transferase n=1 Tax=Pygmaiobacter massiliensis TaxID=1917873 RepID=UPI0028A1DAFC|nr:transferase [Pygmaiobacter massiliensis]
MKKISEKAQISSTVIIHDNVIVEEDAIIHDYVVLYPGTIIKKGAELYDHCVIGKLPTTPGSTARALKESYKEAIVGEYSILCPGVVLYAGTNIGEHTLLGDYCSIREDCNVGDYCIISRNVSVNYETTIGNYTKIMDNSHITGNMKIGNHVFISVLVASTNDNAMGRKGYTEEEIQGACIGDYVTIGAAANILPNVNIGENAIVGAGSVVTRDVPASKLVMGVPAKVIRSV